MISTPLRLAIVCVAPLLMVCATMTSLESTEQQHTSIDVQDSQQKPVQEAALKVQYLEIVTPLINETCDLLAQVHGVTFGDPIPEFGNARTAELKDGGRIGVRAPMRSTEEPVVRPYVLVDDIKAAVNAAKLAGGEIALPPMEIPGGHGTFAIYILGGIEHGLWQL